MSKDNAETEYDTLFVCATTDFLWKFWMVILEVAKQLSNEREQDILTLLVTHLYEISDATGNRPWQTHYQLMRVAEVWTRDLTGELKRASHSSIILMLLAEANLHFNHRLNLSAFLARLTRDSIVDFTEIGYGDIGVTLDHLTLDPRDLRHDPQRTQRNKFMLVAVEWIRLSERRLHQCFVNEVIICYDRKVDLHEWERWITDFESIAKLEGASPATRRLGRHTYIRMKYVI